MTNPTRRQLMTASGSLLAGTTLIATPAHSDPLGELPPALSARIQTELGSVLLRNEAIQLTMPALSENGNSVALEVMAEQTQMQSPVKSVLLFSEKNPIAKIAQFHFPPPPHSQLVHVSTRVRLADSQTIAAVAHTFDDQFYVGLAQVIVTLAACVDLS